MNKKILPIIVLSFLVLSSFPVAALASNLSFNTMSADQELLRVKNETQGTSSWQNAVSANGGDYVRFNVYYHCQTDNSDPGSTEKAQNTRVRITFPTGAQSAITSTAQVLANNVVSSSDTSNINSSSSQQLSFDSTATWYHDNNASVTNVAVSQGSGYVEVNLGDIICDYQNCFTNAGYVVLRARLSSTQTLPTVDLKINGSDGTINLASGTAANLSWTSANATTCSASNDWSGNKATSGSEGTGSVYSNKSYMVTCTGPGGTVSDTVFATLSQAETLFVSLEAIPNNGIAPLSGVDLRATVSGTSLGTINYKFDCTSDGVWDYNFYSIADNPKTVVDACNYPNVGTYWAKVRVERGSATPAEATAQVTVTSTPIVGSSDISVTKLARNASDNTAFAGVTSAKPGDVIEFQISVTSTGSVSVDNIVVKDTLPEKMTFYGALKVDNVTVLDDIQSGYNIGTLTPGQTKKVVFQVIVAGTSSFGFGTTELVNTALSYNTNLARTATVKVQVNKTQVLGATTVSTGLFDNFKLSFLLSLAATMFFSYFLLLRFYLGNRAYVWGLSSLAGSVRQKVDALRPKESNQRAQENLNRVIQEIRAKENR